MIHSSSWHVKKLRFFLLLLFLFSILALFLLSSSQSRLDYLVSHVVIYVRNVTSINRAEDVDDQTTLNTDSTSSTINPIHHQTPTVYCNHTHLSQLTNLSANYTNYIEHNVTSFEQVEHHLKELSIRLTDGGKSFTQINSNCSLAMQDESSSSSSFKRIAFIVPYRDRLANLKVFLYNMHPYLTRQQIEYSIYLIEPVPDVPFNRALLMNIGFIEALRDSLTPSMRGARGAAGTTTKTLLDEMAALTPHQIGWDCFVFHDVDMIPEDKRLVYTCNRDVPLHFAVAVKKFGYKTNGYFSQYFGGVNAFTREQFLKVNGFSTLFFGWGGEDDDMYKRVIDKFHRVGKIPAHIGRYYTHEHEQDKPNEQRWKLLKHSKMLMTNNGLYSTSYEMRNLSKHGLYTHVLVSYDVTHYKNISSKLPP